MHLKYVLLNILILIFSTSLLAQFDNNKVEETDIFSFKPKPENIEKKLSIAPLEKVEKEEEMNTRFGSLIEISSNFPKYSVIKNKGSVSIQDQYNDYKEILYKKFWNGNDVSNARLKTQLELGKLETNTKRIRIECRDHSYVDGDRVKLYVNEEVIRRSITLQGGYYAIDIDLREGFNRIDIEALNQGSSGPNTAEFRVYDGYGNLLADQEWNILTGYVATLVVMKN
jgi:hypothetical protein